MADFFSPPPLFLCIVSCIIKARFWKFYLEDARCFFSYRLFFLISSQSFANWYGNFEEESITLPLSFFFFSASTLSLPPFQRVSARKKVRRGGEGENKSPSVWLSPALSRLSNRGLRSSLLFNLSTEWKQSSSTRLGPPILSLSLSFSPTTPLLPLFFLLFSFLFFHHGTIGESLWFHPLPRPLAFSPISPASALLPPPPPSFVSNPSYQPPQVDICLPLGGPFEPATTTLPLATRLTRICWQCPSSYTGLSLFSPRAPLRIIARLDHGALWIIRGDRFDDSIFLEGEETDRFYTRRD